MTGRSVHRLWRPAPRHVVVLALLTALMTAAAASTGATAPGVKSSTATAPAPGARVVVLGDSLTYQARDPLVSMFEDRGAEVVVEGFPGTGPLTLGPLWADEV